jgi:tRNA G10  N-methylase Trm11
MKIQRQSFYHDIRSETSHPPITALSSKTDDITPEILIHWRGEKSHGNSMKLRHFEFESAIEAVLDQPARIHYVDALSSSTLGLDQYQSVAYENAMQFIQSNISSEDLKIVGQRCSLIRAIFEIVAEGENYEELAKNAVKSGLLDDLMDDKDPSQFTWRVRMRQYGEESRPDKKAQYGKKMRSPMRMERDAIMQMGELFIKFKGEVDLKHADVSIYILEGLHNRRKLLARLLTKGADTSSIAPTTRICITNTPLDPLAAFTMCNVARVKENYKILDPFAGSCAILLAASMMEPTVQSVGVEIAHNGQVNRGDIIRDFEMRNLTLPAEIIKGDSMMERVRLHAKAAVGNQPFDAIITDPPYGIREKIGYCELPPLVNLVRCIAKDRKDSNRLLRVGGRLVAFVPNAVGDDITLDMPSDADLLDAGLVYRQMHEQPLNDSLSRWLVEYECIS